MSDRLKKIIAKQKEIRERIDSMTESQVWQEDYEAAEFNQFAENCLPQKPKINLNHINIEFDGREVNG